MPIKRQISGVLVPTIRSFSSPAFFETSKSTSAQNEFAGVESVPTCDITIDLLALKDKAALETAVLNLTRTVLPDWSKGVSKVNLQRVSGAMTNAVFFVTALDRPRLLLRVYGIGCDQIVDRQNELCWLARLSQMSNSLSPQLLATFRNGRFEEYLDSTTLTHEDLRRPEISCQIARSLRQLHAVVDDYPPPENFRLEVWRCISQWYATVRELLNDPIWSTELQGLELDQLPGQIQKCKEITSSIPSPVVFAHNDTQYGNVLKLAKTGELVIVDFEYAGYNPRGYDIANHFCEWMYDYHSDTPAAMNPEKFPTYDEQISFLRAYLDEQGPTNTSASLDTAEDLQKEASVWVMASHVHWALWGIIQFTQSEIDFDYRLYSAQRLAAFRSELAKWTS